MKRLLLALALVGCIPPLEIDPELERVVLPVWHEVFGAPGDFPTVQWVTGDALNCEGRNGRGFMVGDRCKLGMFFHGNIARVARAEGARIVDTGLPHELGHAMLYWSVHNMDENHEGPVFADGGPVEQAYLRLGATDVEWIRDFAMLHP